jgi:4-amino-4-deoxy-L-arabinose transferase-like glycosyltransferase
MKKGNKFKINNHLKIKPVKNHSKLGWGLLVVIILLAGFLRIWNLDHYPHGFNADEAAFGYNAYSLIETGRDEHGQPWPINFKSFADYKPGVYVYLVLPFVKLLGLNVWAVRLPAALLGTLAVLILMLLVRDLFNEKRLTNPLSLLSGFFLAISPWHLHFARGAWEAGVATVFTLIGVWFFVKAIKYRFSYMLPSVLFFVISVYAYHSTRLITPLLFIGLVIIYGKKVFLKANLKWMAISAGVGVLALLPFIIDFLGPAGLSRFAGVSIFSDSGPFWRVNEMRGQYSNPGALLVRLLHNRVVAYGLVFFQNWLSHFNGNFLFILGDAIARSRVPEVGQMYYFDILFVIVGFAYLFLKKPSSWPLIVFWLLLAPIAAAMTYQSPSALRANMMVMPLVIISAYGAFNLFAWFKKRSKLLRIIFYLLLLVFIPWNISRYLYQYYISYPKTYPFAWEYGFEEIVDYLKQAEGEYDNIYMTERLDQPYILFLFYLKYPPEVFQKEVVLTPRDRFNYSTVHNFGKYHFKSLVWEELKDKPKSLLIGVEGEIPASAKIVKTIEFPQGGIAFQMAETEN